LEESLKVLFARRDFVDSLSWDNVPQKSPWITEVHHYSHCTRTFVVCAHLRNSMCDVPKENLCVFFL